MPFGNHDVIPASCDVINSTDADLKGNNFRRNLQPQSFNAVAFLLSELGGGGGGLPEPHPPPVQKIEEKPGPDRVERQHNIELGHNW